jgi:subtilisin family serine protease
LEILDDVKIATKESVIKTAEENQALDTRISLVQTSMKHPLMILEEKGTKFGQTDEEVTTANAHVATHFMLQVVPGTNLVALEEKLSVLGCKIADKLTDESFIVEINQDPTIDEHYAVKEALEGIQEYVDVVEPDYLVYAIKTPNDNRLLNLWGMHNTGQTGGTNDKDIDAPEAWDLQTGSKKVLVGVIDTGVDRNHEDLKANMWTNPNEIPNNGKDDDGNGYIDDVHGWDFANNDNNPHDDNSHGTHCAGTIGGVGNNGKGVVGVCWDVSMVGIKFLRGSGGGFLSDGVKSIAYATKIGVDLTSNSWGGGGYSSTMKKAIDEANSKGIGFIAAAGNHRGNNDSRPSYPASYDSANIISVGAHDHRGVSASFSCYGKKSVDLFAPGVNTLSTTPGNRYASYSGTSMATPHVAGAYALLLSSNPTWKVTQVKDALMKAVDPESGLKEKCVTGGRLNVYQALTNEPPKGGLIAANPTEIDFGKLSKGDSRVLPVTFHKWWK